MNGKRVFERPDDPQLAAVVCLARALDGLRLPIRVAKNWICPADLPGFIEEIEKRVRALAGFLDTYLEEHRAGFEKVDRETAYILKCGFDGARKNLDWLDRLREMQSRDAADFSGSEELGIRKTATETVVETDACKPTTAVAPPGSAPDFTAEIEELRRLRAGELKTKPPSDLKGLP
jgi:hypothetical protein